MYQWIAHYDNGMRVVRRESIEKLLADVPGAIVLSHKQNGQEYSFNFTLGHFFMDDELIGNCNGWDWQGGEPIAQRTFQCVVGIGGSVTQSQQMIKTMLGIRKNGNAQFISILPDNTYTMELV